ncbi:MAG: hypothetical protein JW929_09590 [Anaerolineales bacterium]|nr:hypothetical protein [Anaerolineales bacterium]
MVVKGGRNIILGAVVLTLACSGVSNVSRSTRTPVIPSDIPILIERTAEVEQNLAPSRTALPSPTATPSREPVPGIDSPVVVQEISLKVYKAEVVDSWEGYSPKDGGHFLVVYVKVVSGVISMSDLIDWKMALTDTKGTVYRRAGAMVHTDDSPDEASWGEWVFDIPGLGPSFLFHFPEGPAVPLDSLIA